MTEQPKEYKFGYFSRHKYQDLVFYIINEDGQTNTGLFEMPDTPENRALMEALIPRPVSTPPEGAASKLLYLLQKWFEAADYGGDASNYIGELYGEGYGYTDTSASIATVMIKHVRENPNKIIARGKKSGWAGFDEF